MSWKTEKGLSRILFKNFSFRLDFRVFPNDIFFLFHLTISNIFHGGTLRVKASVQGTFQSTQSEFCMQEVDIVLALFIHYKIVFWADPKSKWKFSTMYY